MSKKRTHKIKLEIDKFYRVLDGSPHGHPGEIYRIDFGSDTFYAIVTGSMTMEEFHKNGLRKGYIKLKKPIDSNVDISLVKKRPFIGTRNDYGEKEYKDMRFSNEDKILILTLQKNNPIYGKNYKKKNPNIRGSRFKRGSASNK